MKKALQNLGLYDRLRMELPISRNDFVRALSAHVDDTLSSGRKIYKGTVTSDSFELKRKRRLFDTNLAWIKLQGKFREKDNALIIDIELSVFHALLIPFLIFGIIAYGVAIPVVVADTTNGNVPAWMTSFIVLHAVLMFGIPYFIARNGIQASKYNIERDLFYLL